MAHKKAGAAPETVETAADSGWGSSGIPGSGLKRGISSSARLGPSFTPVKTWEWARIIPSLPRGMGSWLLKPSARTGKEYASAEFQTQLLI